MNFWTRYPIRLLLVCGCALSGPDRGAAAASATAEASAKDKQAWSGELRAGTAKINITPENPKKPVHDNVNARVLVLEIGGKRLAFVSVDLGIFTSEHLVATCKEKFGFRKFC